jgi:hypothetical protein
LPVAPITRILDRIVLLFFGICYLKTSLVSKMMRVLEAERRVALAVVRVGVLQDGRDDACFGHGASPRFLAILR